MRTDDDLAARVHRNLMRVTSWMGEDPGGALDVRDGELLCASGSSLPFLNIAMRERPGGDADALVERARAFFGGLGRGYILYTHPGDPELERAGLAAGLHDVLPRYPEMVCRAPLDPLPGDVRPVETVEDAAAYWRICDAAYPSLGMPEGLFTEVFSPESLLRSDRLVACLGRHDGEPVACASLCLADGVGMVGWVGALPAARGRGLAAACTVWATNRAFALGADVASLQASYMGEPIYRRLGYEELYAYRLLGEMPRA
jgi:GNAT superfamily N-acetyltransferase